MTARPTPSPRLDALDTPGDADARARRRSGGARRPGALAAALTVVALSATACSIGTTTGIPPVATVSPGNGAQSGQSGAPQVDGTIAGFYGQQPDWQTCSADEITTTGQDAPRDLSAYQCATLVAPLDWDDPAGATITLRIGRHLAGANSKGALFYNLGGPGGASVNALSSMVTSNFGDDLVAGYDLVGMDPRGVGASTPIVCMTDQERDEYNAGEADTDDADLAPDQIVAHADEVVAKFGQGCLDHSGDLTAHVDTVSAAKDFDMARAVLGEDAFTYFGYSYGTFLGATYADLFPDRVGRMVLDGALDPAMDVNQVSDLQMRGFEAALTHWIEDCQAGSGCPLTGSTDDGVAAMKSFLDGLADAPLPTQDPDRPLTQSLALTAVIGMLYSTQTYSALTQAMQQALGSSDGSILLYLADFLNDRNDDGTYASNGTDALMAVNALDYEPVGTVDDWAADAAQLQADLPILGDFAGYSSAGLGAWPVDRHAHRGPIAATGAPTIVVVGTTHDPATPYVMAQNLAGELDDAVLVTWDGWSHTAYSKSGSVCVAKAVEGYLLDGTVPQDGLTCTD